MSIDPPKKKDVTQPKPKAIAISYRDCSGLRGAYGRNHIMQSDNQSTPNVSVYSEEDIYLNAIEQVQISSKVVKQNTTNRLIQ